MIVEHDAGGCIEDGSSLIVIEIGRDNSVLGVSDDAGEFGAFACCFHNGLDFIVSCGLFEHAGEVNNRNVNGGNAHAHAGQLAVKSGDDLADCLCCTGAAGDDVVCCRTSAAPILAGRTVNSKLGCGDGMNGGHKTLFDAEIIVDNLCKRCKAVGCAACIGNNVHVGLVFLVVYTHNEHGSCILCGCGDDDLLCAAYEMLACEFGGGELTGGFNNVFCAAFTPGDLLGIHAVINADSFAVDNELSVFNLDFSVKPAVNGVIPEQISHVFKVDEGIVDAHYSNVGIRCCCAENEPADAAEAVDADFGCHE